MLQLHEDQAHSRTTFWEGVSQMTSKCALSGFVDHNTTRKVMAQWGQETGALYFPPVLSTSSVFLSPLHARKTI